jgi:hypothetical protein
MVNFVFGLLILANTSFVLEEIRDQDIFYNFIYYQNELYVGSNKGIYLIDPSGSREMILYDQSVVGPINSVLSQSEGYLAEFIEVPEQLSELYPYATTDIAYQGNDCYLISRGKLLVYHKPLFSFSPHRSVRSISPHGIGTYGGVYISGEKLKKITYTDGKIREFGDITMVCYNGLLKYEDNQEVVLYDNDNSIRSNAEYGLIRDIFSIGQSKYLLISTKGIYEYDEQSGIFELLYVCQKKIITVGNKIDDRISDRGEFHFMDNGRYISLDLKRKGFYIIDNAIDDRIINAIECEINGNHFFVVTEDSRLLKYQRVKEGLELINQVKLESAAHTIVDFKDIIFLASNSGLSIFNKTKNQIAVDIIIDEFNSDAFYKSSTQISFGGINGVYTFNDLLLLEKELVFKDYIIANNKGSLLLGGVVSSLLLCIGFITFRFRKKTIVSDEQMISRIKRFINLNLPSVTLKMLELELDLDYNELNSLSKNFKPAKYIKERRGAIAKEMLLADELISEVSKKTGYSETYIVKNKYRFIK